MKVLQLPTNIASQMRVTVLALREMGFEARGLTGPSPVQNAAGLEILPRGGEQDSFLMRKARAVQRAAVILKAISWADVVHWHYGPGLPLDGDLRVAAMLGRKRFVEVWGSDIRDPEIEMADNPYYARAWASGEYECKASESRAGSRNLQRRFAKHGARLLVALPGLVPYVLPEAFPQFTPTAQRVSLDEYEPAIPPAANARPLVVHAPSAPGVKGSKYIVAAAEKLRAELDFDFQLIEGMHPLEARAWISRCDIFVDQLVCGDYGLAAVEAMALGKPVICYVKPSLRQRLPAHFPVIDANPDNMEEVLRELLKDGPRRRRAGEESRAWAEERHDARKVVARIAECYRTV